MKQLALKVDTALVFLDLKVALIAWILIDLYRNTVLLANLNLSGFKTFGNVLRYVWSECGAPYIPLIIGAVVLDVVIKRVVKVWVE